MSERTRNAAMRAMVLDVSGPKRPIAPAWSAPSAAPQATFDPAGRAVDERGGVILTMS
jgi:hypothetical protein